MITLALSKGRIFEEVLPFLAAAGIRPLENPEDSRKLMIGTNREDLRIVVLRATDVPTYVQYGAADLGVAGWDSLYEHGGNGLYVPVDLGIARCRMSVAAPRGFDWDTNVRRGSRIRVATKYIKWSRDYFAREGVHVDLIKLYGSMELAPIAGLADAIVDLVSTGSDAQSQQYGGDQDDCADFVAPHRQSGCHEAQARRTDADHGRHALGCRRAPSKGIRTQDL